MLSYGNQIKAARALCGLNQAQLANLADLNVNTIRAMEARGECLLTSGLETVRKVETAFAMRGVEFYHDEKTSGVIRQRVA